MKWNKIARFRQPHGPVPPFLPGAGPAQLPSFRCTCVSPRRHVHFPQSTAFIHIVEHAVVVLFLEFANFRNSAAQHKSRIS